MYRYFQVGIAILLNLVAFSPLARAKVQQSDNIDLICQILKLEKDKLMNLHDGNITIDMNSTRYYHLKTRFNSV